MHHNDLFIYTHVHLGLISSIFSYLTRISFLSMPYFHTSGFSKKKTVIKQGGIFFILGLRRRERPVAQYLFRNMSTTRNAKILGPDSGTAGATNFGVLCRNDVSADYETKQGMLSEVV